MNHQERQHRVGRLAGALPRPPPIALAALIAYPLLLWLPLRVDLALFALAGIGIAAVLFQEPARTPTAWPLPDLLLLLYLAWSATSIALAPDLLRALALSSALLPAALLYVLAARYLCTLLHLHALIVGVLVSGAALAFTIVLTVMARSPPQHDSAALVEAVASPILIVPNDVLWLACIVPLGAAMLLRRPIWARVLLAGALLLLIAAIVVLQSRAALLGAMLGVAATFATSGITRGRLGRLLGVAALVLLAGLVTDALLGFPLAHKFSSLCFSRGPFWSAAWSLFLERPWLGHGAHSFVDLYQARLPAEPALFCEQMETRLTPWPHNLFLELLASQGLLGALPIMAALAWALSTSFNLSRRPDPAVAALGAGLLGVWTVFVFAAVFELSLLRLWVVTGFALFLGMTVSLKCIANDPGRQGAG